MILKYCFECISNIHLCSMASLITTIMLAQILFVLCPCNKEPACHGKLQHSLLSTTAWKYLIKYSYITQMYLIAKVLIKNRILIITIFS